MEADHTPPVSTENEARQPVTDPSGAVSDEAGLLKDIGRRLRQARKARDEKLDDLVRELKLRKVYLRALEQGNWDDLPDRVYALGFLRQYAAHLKLDIEDDIQRLKQGQYKLTRPLTFPDPPVAPSRRWAWIAGIAFVVLLIAFNVFRTDDGMPPEKPESAQQRAAPASVPSTEEANNDGQVALTPAETNTQNKDSGAVSGDASIPPPQASSHAPSVPAMPSATHEDGGEHQTMATAPEADDLSLALESRPPASKVRPILPLHSYQFDAVDDAVWLQVFLPAADGKAKGELRKEVLLKPGHHLTLNESAPRLWVTTGNAGALQISIDHKLLHAAGSLGERGKVLRDFVVAAAE